VAVLAVHQQDKTVGLQDQTPSLTQSHLQVAVLAAAMASAP